MSDAIRALRASHDRLASIVAGLSPEQVGGRAYPTEWSVAQVLSHLGSGAEIAALAFDAALAGTAAPGREANPPIWDRWNAKDPDAMAGDGVASDRALLERFEALDASQHADLRFQSFMGPVSTDQLARLRLNEHAVHTWDVAVALDAAATLGPEAVGLILESLGFVVRFAGKANGLDTTVRVVTTDPHQEFTLTFGDPVSLAVGGDAPASASLVLPAEAFIRLVHGRLDPDHTPPLAAEGVDVDDLRRAFPGF